MEFFDQGTADIPCLYQDALKLAGRIGQPILIARREPFGAATYIALANIGDVFVLQADEPGLRLKHIHPLARPVPLVATPPDTSQLMELTTADFEHIVLQASGEAEWAESATPQHDLFTQQLAIQQDEKCAFSGVRTAEGMAFIIRPLEQGGRWHIGNFLFCDAEAGEQFSALAWTIGPALEVIIDTYAIAPGMADTVNGPGRLAVPEDVATTLDRDALAWHREQFFARLRG